jgi:hypothetical protein
VWWSPTFRPSAFQRGALDIFVLRGLEDVGQLAFLNIGHDGSGSHPGREWAVCSCSLPASTVCSSSLPACSECGVCWCLVVLGGKCSA